MATLEKIEFAKLDSCRFIGKSVYAPPGSGELYGALWANSETVFEAIDKLHEYATDEVHNVALLSWDRYTEETIPEDGVSSVLGYYIACKETK